MVALNLFFTALSGALFSLSFKPVGFWFCAPIAFAYLFHQLRSKRIPVAHAVVFAFTANLIILSWTSTFVGALPWLLLVLLQASYFIPLGIAARYTQQIPIFIALIILIESVKSRFPFGGFSWTRIAFSQVDSPFSPLVAYVGVTALSVITLVISLSILQRKKLLAIGLILIALLSQLTTSHLSSEEVRVRAIQGGVPARGLDFNARAMQVLDNHMKTTLMEIDGDEDLIIWPENAIDVDPLLNKEVAEKISNLSQKIDTPLLAGAILDGDRLLNSTILFNEDGHATSIYIKRYLTPFGEYIPLRAIASAISSDANRVTDFSPGDRFVIHKIGAINVGSIICYEILNDGLVREAASKSGFLVVHTNSATFAGSSEGEQQLAITRLRAIETGKSIVSVSTTGPSAVINRRGVVSQKLSDGAVGSVNASVPIIDKDTSSTSLGGWAELAILFALLTWAVISLRKERHRETSYFDSDL